MGPQKKYTKCTVTGFHPLSVVHNFPYLWQHFSSTLVKISIEVDLHCCPIRKGCFYVQKEPECLLFWKLCTKLFLGHGIFLSSHWFFNMLGRWEAWRCTSSLTLSMAPPIWLVWTFNVSSIFLFIISVYIPFSVIVITCSWTIFRNHSFSLNWSRVWSRASEKVSHWDLSLYCAGRIF